MSVETSAAAAIDRQAAIAWYQRNRARSRQIFDLIDPAAYYSRPIALRNPVVFYEGHLPAFSLIAFVKRGLGLPGVDARLEDLFARGIDPDTADGAVPRSGAQTVWPTRDEVLAFGAAADALMLDLLSNAAMPEDRPAMRRAEALYTALEHEAMHQETLLYMWHRLPHDQKRKPHGLHYAIGDAPPSYASALVPAGIATLGADRSRVVFGWDNEFDAHDVSVGAFDMDVHNVTNADFMTFVEARGYANRALWTDAEWQWIQDEGVQCPAFWRRGSEARGGSAPEAEWFWRGMFENIPLPPAWPVYVSQAEASAYARWKGRRLPTEAEYHRAALGASPVSHDFSSWEPVPAGSRPDGRSAWGIHDLIGNGWEWTSTPFAPFPGFTPMPSYPEYSAEFFDGAHYVMKGASPATARELVRESFRNWFRPNYPYVYATFRTVGGA